MGLLAARLRLRAARHRDHRRGHARRPGRTPSTGGRGRRTTTRSSQKPDRDRLFAPGRGRRARRRARLRRRPLPAAPVRPALPLHERADRGRDDHERADVGDPPGALAQRDRARACTVVSLGPEQRRLRPRVLDRRADRGHALRHRRRLHRDQVGPQRRRPAPRRPGRAHRRARLPHARRPRRGDDRQRGERERARRLRGADGDEQPRPRARDPLQDERDARAARSRTCSCATWRSARSGSAIDVDMLYEEGAAGRLHARRPQRA